MNKLKIQWVTFLMVVVAMTVSFSCGRADATQTGPVTLWRMYNPTLIRHYYTTDLSEVATFQGNGWNKEGDTGIGQLYQDSKGVPGLVPFYRLYNPTSKVYLYTVDSAEGDRARKQGFDAPVVVGYVFPPSSTAPAGKIPLYRASRTTGGDYFYTINLSEYQNLNPAEWSQDGVACYLEPIP